tara:strand:- start:137 stop:676 length:540 start_codon:yes stop_codon:yes gene_type:complete
MNSSDITNTVIIIIIFALINITSILGSGIDHIESNWDKYKCMPIIIPFAGLFGKDSNETFNSCSRNILMDFQSDMLGPLYTVLNKIAGVGGQIGGFMSMFNGLGNNYKFSFLNMLSSVYSVGSKIILGVTHFSIAIQDMINRVIGIVITVIYVLIGANITILSIWNGLPGQLVRTVTGG